MTIQVPIIWSDETIIAVNKPSGLPTLPDGYDKAAPYLVGVLKRRYDRLWVVHRLDRDTSGVLVLALTAEAHRALNTQFQDRRTVKVYHALVAGAPVWDELVIDLPLRPNSGRRHRTVVDAERGKPAETHLRVLDRFQRYTLIEATPHTGRTHQIRAHLAAVGLPIVGDALYGDGAGIYLSAIKPDYQPHSGPEHALIGRLALHARSLTIEHPVTGERLELEAPYPKDFEAALRYLRKYANLP